MSTPKSRLLAGLEAYQAEWTSESGFIPHEADLLYGFWYDHETMSKNWRHDGGRKQKLDYKVADIEYLRLEFNNETGTPLVAKGQGHWDDGFGTTGVFHVVTEIFVPENTDWPIGDYGVSNIRSTRQASHYARALCGNHLAELAYPSREYMLNNRSKNDRVCAVCCRRVRQTSQELISQAWNAVPAMFRAVDDHINYEKRQNEIRAMARKHKVEKAAFFKRFEKWEAEAIDEIFAIHDSIEGGICDGCGEASERTRQAENGRWYCEKEGCWDHDLEDFDPIPLDLRVLIAEHR